MDLKLGDEVIFNDELLLVADTKMVLDKLVYGIYPKGKDLTWVTSEVLELYKRKFAELDG